MSNETKRDVLKDIVDTLHVMDGAPDDYCKKLIDHYDAALPDDLPVIPENISEAIKALKYEDATLMDVYQAAAVKNLFTGVLSDWINENINAFARAWVLGVWRIEETGEIVKLEADD